MKHDLENDLVRDLAEAMKKLRAISSPLNGVVLIRRNAIPMAPEGFFTRMYLNPPKPFTFVQSKRRKPFRKGK